MLPATAARARARRAELAILVPVLARPHRVAPLLASIAASTPCRPRVLFIVDEHDVDERAAIADAGGQELVCDGSYARKINAGVAATTEPLLFLGADDLRFHTGWLEAALARLTGDVGVVGTNDLGNPRVVAGHHATHCLVARWYARLGSIDAGDQLLHEGYTHNFCDDEFVATARRRGAWSHARGSIVEHQHPNWGKADTDATYQAGQASFNADRLHFLSRRPLWT